MVELRLPPLYGKQYAAVHDPRRIAVIEASSKAGKAQPLHATVWTPTGPVRMGDLKVGDLVCVPDGGSAPVTGVHPQGERQIYRVTFSDGTEVEADGEHLWEVHKYNSKPVVLTTEQVAALPESLRRRSWVPSIQPVEFDAKDVPLDPYLVGVLIGDGGVAGESVRLSGVDDPLLDEVRRMIPPHHILKHSGGCDWTITAGAKAASMRGTGRHIVQILRSLGMMGKHAYDKRVPALYRYNSIAVRRAVLQGILDTDGFVDKHGQPGIEQTSEGLARDITEIVQSLGGSVLTNYRARNGYVKDGTYHECRPVWRQSIRFPDCTWCFRLPRKAAITRPKVKTGHRFFRTIEPIGIMPAQCIEVGHPRHLYLTDGFIPTHNTAGCLVWILGHAWNDKTAGHSYWWVAPVYQQSRIAFDRMKAWLRQSDPHKRVWKSHDTEMWVELASGSRIWFKSGDDPDNLYGEDVYGAVLDEATRMREESWHAVRSTLTATRAPVRIIGNVRGRRNWVHRLAQRAQSEPAGDIGYHRLTAWDAVEGGVIRREEVEAAKRDLPASVFRELYLAEPSDDGGNPFGIDAIAKCVRPDTEGAVAVWGVDLAKSQDWTVACGLDMNGSVVALDRWQGQWADTKRRLTGMIGETPALIDSTGVGDPIVEDLQRDLPAVEGFKFTAPSKQQLMEGLAAAIQQGRIGIPDGWLRSELEAFGYEHTRTGVRYEAPAGLHDDGVCALALAVRHLAYAATNTLDVRIF